MIIAHTIKGKGVSFMEGSPLWHGSVKLSEDQVRQALRDLGTPEVDIPIYQGTWMGASGTIQTTSVETAVRQLARGAVELALVLDFRLVRLRQTDSSKSLGEMPAQMLSVKRLQPGTAVAASDETLKNRSRDRNDVSQIDDGFFHPARIALGQKVPAEDATGPDWSPHIRSSEFF
jgi:hypothetical protein